MEQIIATDRQAATEKRRRAGRSATTRSPELREITRSLAKLSVRRVKKAEALNVRRREQVRRALTMAGEELGWAQVAALRDDPVEVAARDVKEMLRSGLRSLKQVLRRETAKKEAEIELLEEVLETVRALAEDPDSEYPVEITYTHTARDGSQGFVTKTETIEVGDPDEAQAAAKKMEQSLSTWSKYQLEMLEDLDRRRQSLDEASRNLSDVLDSWNGLFREVLVTLT